MAIPGDARIDIHQQTRLSDRQCDIAIAIWSRLGVFNTESSKAQAIKNRFRESVIWAATFRNYNPFEDKHLRKLKRLTTQVINRYKDTIDYSGVDRIDYSDGGEHWCVICKPERGFGMRRFEGGVATAATHIVKSDKTNTAYSLGFHTPSHLLQKIEQQIPNLIERRKFLVDFQEAVTRKTIELDRLIDLTMTPDQLPPPVSTEEEDDDDDEVEF